MPIAIQNKIKPIIRFIVTFAQKKMQDLENMVVILYVITGKTCFAVRKFFRVEKYTKKSYNIPIVIKMSVQKKIKKKGPVVFFCIFGHYFNKR